MAKNLQVGDLALSRASTRDWVALAFVMLPTLLVSIDNTVLDVALPKIAAALEPTGVQQLWIIDAYPLVLAGLLVAMGSLGDRFGRLRMLHIGSTGFAAVSAAAAFAPSAEWLIAARFVLGIFGSMLIPSTLSLLRSIFLDPRQRTLAIAVWGAGFSAGFALGPILGGVILEFFEWGSVFLIAVPLLVPMLIGAPLTIRESKDENAGRIDVLSIVLSLLAMAPVVFAIKEIATRGFELPLILIGIFGLVCAVLFVRRQGRIENPILDLGLMKTPAFAGGILANLTTIIALAGFLYVTSQHLQLVVGLSPLQAGLVYLPGSVVGLVAGLYAARLVRRVSPGQAILGGLVLMVIAFALFVVVGKNPPLPAFIIGFALLSMGACVVMTLVDDLVLAIAPPARAGAASAASETSLELGTVLGTTVIGGAMTTVYQSHLHVPEGVSAEQAAAAKETLAGAEQVARSLPADVADALVRSAQDALDTGMLIAAIGGGVVMIVGVMISWFTLRSTSAEAQTE